MVQINDMPDEVLEFIMSHLPPYKDLDECSLVCRRWANVVHNVKRHTKINMNNALSEYRMCWKSLETAASVSSASASSNSSTTIAPRFSHAAVVHGHSMYIFGGGSSATTTFNDMWRFDLSRRVWIRPLSTGSYPSPKACATIVAYRDALILFGGWRHPSSYPPFQPWRLFNELHVYNVTANRWTVQTPAVVNSGPPPMTGHSATMHSHRMIVFGGYHKNDEVNPNTSNDVWCLDLDTYVWHQPETSKLKPPPRYGQFQVALDAHHLLVMGGCGGPNNILNDAWLLDMTESDVWSWKVVTIKNKKWASKLISCNPACKVGSKLVVLGATAAMPSDFQMIRQHMPCAANRNLPRQNHILPLEANRFNNHHHHHHHHNQQQPPPPQAHRQQQHQIMEEANRRLQEERNRPINRDNIGGCGGNSRHGAAVAAAGPAFGNLNRRNRIADNDDIEVDEDEAASRLKRNLQLKSRADEDPYLPKRFDEPIQDRLSMAAFNVQPPTAASTPHDRRLESLRRMEEKMRAMQREREQEEPHIPKRFKRNCIGLFVCDISKLLDAYEPVLEWIEYKNYGIVPGAPERLAMSTIVAGNGELIMFGGLQKETLSNGSITQVSNALNVLTFPRDII